MSSALVTTPRRPFEHKRDHVLLHGIRTHLRPPASMVRALFPGQTRPDRRMLNAVNPNLALPRALPMSTMPRAEKNRPRRIPRVQRSADRLNSKNREAQARAPPSSNPPIAHPYYTPQNIWGREGQLATMAEGALNLPLIAPSAHTPWVPPSRRSASIVGQLGSSSPPQAHTRDGASAHSPEMLSVEGSSRPSSATSPPYPLQAEQLANQKMTVTDMQMARLLQQAED
jgi:hypothetical protein